MADMKAIATLAYDLYHGKVAKDFTNGKDPEKQLYSHSRKKMSGCWGRIFAISRPIRMISG